MARPPLNGIIDRLDAATAGRDLPLAALDMASLRVNLDDLARRAGGTPIRVASKSVRCREVLETALRHPGFAGVMAYSLREAIWLVGERVCGDVLLGYPTADAGALAVLGSGEHLRESITLMIDSTDHVDMIAALAPGAQVCVDVDASLRVGPLHLGVRRSPVRTAAEAAAVAAAAERNGLRVAGVMFYEAQIAGLPDANPAVRLVKSRSAAQLLRRRRAVVRAVADAIGREPRFVNGGGTGSLEVSGSDATVTELTAGSGLFMPALFDNYRAFSPHPALFFALPVVRRPTSRISTLLYGGYVASGPPGSSRLPVVAAPAGLRLLRAEGAGEVQTPVRGALPVGGRVWLRHAKAGELCERFSEIALVEPDGSTRAVPTYRGEGQCFG